MSLPGREVGHEHDGELEALRRVDGQDTHGARLRLFRSRLDRPESRQSLQVLDELDGVCAVIVLEVIGKCRDAQHVAPGPSSSLAECVQREVVVERLARLSHEACESRKVLLRGELLDAPDHVSREGYLLPGCWRSRLIAARERLQARPQRATLRRAAHR